MIDGKIVKKSVVFEAGASAGGFVRKAVPRKYGRGAGYIRRRPAFPERADRWPRFLDASRIGSPESGT
jgi:hypothetical protein